MAPDTKLKELSQDCVADAGSCSMDVEDDRMSLVGHQNLFCNNDVGYAMLVGHIPFRPLLLTCFP